jgi:hypothetical protein
MSGNFTSKRTILKKLCSILSNASFPVLTKSVFKPSLLNINVNVLQELLSSSTIRIETFASII